MRTYMHTLTYHTCMHLNTGIHKIATGTCCFMWESSFLSHADGGAQIENISSEFLTTVNICNCGLLGYGAV
jgi:hypothetical protein